MGKCMGLFSTFFARPAPLRCGIDVSDDRLSTVGNMHVLHRHLLLALRTVILQRRDLRREIPGQFVERALRRILLRDILDVGEAAGEGR